MVFSDTSAMGRASYVSRRDLGVIKGNAWVIYPRSKRPPNMPILIAPQVFRYIYKNRTIREFHLYTSWAGAYFGYVMGRFVRPGGIRRATYSNFFCGAERFFGMTAVGAESFDVLKTEYLPTS